MKKENCYDIVVIGGGHAGCEAALVSARMGCKTLLITLDVDNIALMPCNPSVGGPAKGPLVREVDALGGQIGINVDKSNIQIRLLNTAKGPAVRALRAQIDKAFYKALMVKTLLSQDNLEIKQAEVTEIILEGDRVVGLRTKTDIKYQAAAIVVTSGTYLRGKVFLGNAVWDGGTFNYSPSNELEDSLRGMGLELGRFKTGTPPRVDKRSIDFSKLIEQKGDDANLRFSFMTDYLDRPNISCWLAYTSEKTHEIIRNNLDKSPLYEGLIEGKGPRYCPSIEDKVVRFADKNRHQIFLEPEGFKSNEYYVQGLSSSLPEAIQNEMIKTVVGLENVKTTRPGYAVEYTYLIPKELTLYLETKKIKGLFFAGQINGTSGYEEAAAQGLIAGINAVNKIKGKEPFILSRAQAYIGVLIDDLVTKGIIEPYRILTSRAEYRLLLRQDNADLRLTEIGYQIGTVDERRYKRFVEKMEAIESQRQHLRDSFAYPDNAVLAEYLSKSGSSELKQRISYEELLKRPEVTIEALEQIFGKLPVDSEVKEQVQVQVKYEGYIKKQKQQVNRFEKLESKKIPADVRYNEVKGLRKEAEQRLDEIRPTSIGQASRISGVSPADINVLLIFLEQRNRSKQK